MTLPNLIDVSTAHIARQLAINWQSWASEHSLHYQALAAYQGYFATLAERFPELTDEFKENGIL